MKIALMMENSQAGKNATIHRELKAVADEKGFPVFNVGMSDENGPSSDLYPPWYYGQHSA